MNSQITICADAWKHNILAVGWLYQVQNIEKHKKGNFFFFYISDVVFWLDILVIKPRIMYLDR